MRQRNKLFLLLALLMTAATGAWAQTETLLVTIENKGNTSFTSGSKTFDDKVTVTFSNSVINEDDDWGWYAMESTLLTVAGADGYTITRVKFYSALGSAFDEEAPFEATVASTHTYVNGTDIGQYGVNKIEVYGYEGAAPPTYTVSLKNDVKDADKWTITPNEGLKEGDPVTLTYSGRLKVKGVKATSDAAPAANTVDLSTLTENTELKDGDVATGTLAGNYKITIADGATVTLDGVTINGVNDTNYEWAGITCEGDATIILSGTNTVKGFYEDYPGIQAAADKTLTINGTGSLTASSYGWGAGIGGVNEVACGNITISGGTVTATGGQHCAGIGGGSTASCGNITISGGTVIAEGGEYGAGIGGADNASWGNITISGGTVTATGGERGAGIGGGRKGSSGSVTSGNILISGGTVTATGGENAAGIGGGRGYNNGKFGSCGDITITTGVTKVTATMGEGSTNSIGAGKFCTCGTVTIGGNVGAITESPYTYQPSN